jgi:hypothetical protein
VTDPTKSATDYQIVAFAYTQPFAKPPTQARPDPTVIAPMGTVQPDATWTLTIRYADNAGRVYFDDHVGVYDARTNPRGADQLVKQITSGNYSTTSINKTLLQHLIAEHAIPPATITGHPER